MTKTIVSLFVILFFSTGCAQFYYAKGYKGPDKPQKDVALFVAEIPVKWQKQYDIKPCGGFEWFNDQSFMVLVNSVEALPGKYRYRWQSSNTGVYQYGIGEITMGANEVYALVCKDGRYFTRKLPFKYSDVRKNISGMGSPDAYILKQ